nr:hypothetical protein BaRGS_026138 [Batillaria attramentaria]
MDQSKLRQIRLYRHKTELMYRSSLTNEDRTSILLHNNPMPDITETVPASRQRGMSARSEMLRRFQSEWQPLSMNALVEYKKQLDTVGEGQN